MYDQLIERRDAELVPADLVPAVRPLFCGRIREECGHLYVRLWRGDTGAVSQLADLLVLARQGLEEGEPAWEALAAATDEFVESQDAGAAALAFVELVCGFGPGEAEELARRRREWLSSSEAEARREKAREALRDTDEQNRRLAERRRGNYERTARTTLARLRYERRLTASPDPRPRPSGRRAPRRRLAGARASRRGPPASSSDDSPLAGRPKAIGRLALKGAAFGAVATREQRS